MRCGLLTTLITLGLLFGFGCAESEYNAASAPADSPAAEEAYSYTPQADYAEAEAVPSLHLSESDGRLDRDRSEIQPINASNPTPKAADARKIIYNANVDLVVDAFDGVAAKVQALAKQHGGFIARSNITGSQGEPRYGDWTLRIPSQNFDAMLTGAQDIGQVRSINSDSREVTAEYVDLASRVRNLKAEEERLHRHLNESTRSLKDILEVERQIARVRGEIERHQGRLNVLRDLTSLSTVSLTVSEIKDYAPEPTQEPGYKTQVARVWGESVGAVGGFLTRVSLALVRLTPWLVVIVPAGLLLWWVGKRVMRLAKPGQGKPPAPAGI